MGLLPSLMSYTVDSSGFNSVKTVYGSAAFHAVFSNNATTDIEYIPMSDSDVYFSLISDATSYIHDCAVNGASTGEKVAKFVLLANHPFSYTLFSSLEGSYESLNGYKSETATSQILKFGNYHYHSLLVFTTAGAFTASSVANYVEAGTGYYTDTHTTVLSAISDYGIVPSDVYPITYRLTNCTAPSAPTEAVIGDIVNISLQFTSGYGIVNPSSDVYVTNNGVVIPSQYSNGILTFTMPDPS